MAAYGNREPDNFRSYLRSTEFRILLGAGLGYVSGRLLNRREDLLRSKLSVLNSVPTIPISSIKRHEIPKQGELVFIENGMVFPLSSVPVANYQNQDPPVYCDGVEVVVSKKVTTTYIPQEFKELFPAISSTVDVYRVPFALVGGKFFRRNSFVIVKKADTDHLVLEDRETATVPLEPTIKLTKRVVKGEGEEEHEISSTVKVSKVSKESVLRTGRRLQSVFGRLSRWNGLPQIEPCPDFPKACFTMTREEIKEMVRDQVYGDVYPSRKYGIGFGVLSFGLLLSGFYSAVTS